MSWWEGYYKDADKLDVEKVSAWYAPNIELHFSGSEPAHGKAVATEAFRQFTAGMAQMKHTFGVTVAKDDEVFLDTTFSCRLKNGKEVTAKMGTYLRRENGLIRDMRGYGDLSPVMAAMASEN
jgi:ketosteroid isomerase-like protein